MFASKVTFALSIILAVAAGGAYPASDPPSTAAKPGPAPKAGAGKSAPKAGAGKSAPKAGAKKTAKPGAASGSKDAKKDKADESSDDKGGDEESEAEDDGEKNPFSRLHQAKEAVDAMRSFAPPPTKVAPILEELNAAKEAMGKPPERAKKESWIKPSASSPEEGTDFLGPKADRDVEPPTAEAKPSGGNRPIPAVSAADRLRKHARKAPIVRYRKTKPATPPAASKPRSQ